MQNTIPSPALDTQTKDQDLADAVRLHDLPSMPAVTIRLVQSFADPDTPISEIVGLLQSDPALAVKIVRAANSPRYQVGRRVTDLHRAAMLLGRKVITSLALTFTLSDSSLNSGPDAQYFQDYWLQSVIQSMAMATLAERYSPRDVADYQIAGLLMDIGRLALLSTADGVYRAVIDEARDMGRPLASLEAERLGVTHAELSARFLTRWGLPETLAAAIRMHHDRQPRRSFPDEVVDDRLVVATQIGAAVGDHFCSASRGIAWLRLNELMAEHFQAASSEVESLVNDVRMRVDESSQLFNANTKSLCSPLELMSLALRQLAEIALTAGDEVDQRSNLNDALPDIDQARVEQITRESCLDPSYHVYRRSYLEDRFRNAVANATPGCTGIGLLIAAVRSGPGDVNPSEESCHAVMQQVADVLNSSIRPTDIVAREDEDAFAVLVVDVTADDVERLRERMLSRLTATPIRFPDSKSDALLAIGGTAVPLPASNTPNIEDLRSCCRDALDVTADTVVVDRNWNGE